MLVAWIALPLTLAAVCAGLGLHRAVAFDDDFAVYRFGPRRDRAFEILR